MRIPTNDLKRHLDAIHDVLDTATARVVESGWYIFGEEGASFEREFAAYCGTRACVGWQTARMPWNSRYAG
jgi:dTDP-4-amino-4,6-dideoxygalactose transaminase